MASVGVFDLLHPRLREALASLGYREATPAQEAAIPRILAGSHVLLIAPTGFGKTEAAVLPVVSMMLGMGLGDCVYALYVTPLRSLNRDLERRIRAIGEAVGVRVDVRHSDTPKSARRGQVRRPPHLLITTPETLQILLLHRGFRPLLRCVRWVVVDEVHELAQSKRGAQLAVGLERLVELAGEFQRIGLSATVGNPGAVAAFLGGAGRAVEIVDVSGEKRFEVSVVVPEPGPEDLEGAERLDVTPEAHARIRTVAEIVSRAGTAIVFTNTRDFAEFLASRLRAMGISVDVHHSSLSREHRLGVEERLRRGELKAVVATSSLELGIDIGHVSLVVQYGSPHQAMRLLQRVGRAGHRLGEVSRGIVVALDEDDADEARVLAERVVGRRLEREFRMHEAPLDILAHQLVGMALEARLDGRGIDLGYVLRVVRRAYPYREVTLVDLGRVAEFMERIGLLRGLSPRRGAYKYYFSNVSPIPDEASYEAVDTSAGRRVGELDEEFVYTVEPGQKIVLSGRVWRISAIDQERRRVELYPEEDVRGALPGWIGEELPVLREVAEEVCARRGERLGLPIPQTVLVHVYRRFAIVHHCLGTRGGEALGVYLARHVSGYLGPVPYRADAYRVLIEFRDVARPELIVDALSRGDDYVARTVTEGVKASRLFRYRLMQVLRRFGVIERDATQIPQKVLDVYADDLPGEEAIREILTDRVDLEALLSLVAEVRSGRRRIEVRRVEEPTPIDKPILEEALRYDFAFRGVPRETIRDIVRRRVEEREVGLVCAICGHAWTAKVRLLPDRPRCPRCGSSALAVVKNPSELARASDVLRKKRLGMKLTRDEAKYMADLATTVDLVMRFGKTAVIVLAAHGVGPATAKRVLATISRGSDIWDAVIAAEREYAAKKIFFD